MGGRAHHVVNMECLKCWFLGIRYVYKDEFNSDMHSYKKPLSRYIIISHVCMHECVNTHINKPKIFYI
jgi:hypothetical protein